MKDISARISWGWTIRITQLLAAALLTLFVPRLASGQATFTVNSVADPGTGTCDATECTLREAILAANASPGLDRIEFAIPGGGAHVISPTSPLPVVSDPVVLDGYSQPGAIENANETDQGLNSILAIELEGSSAGDQATGLEISAGNSTIRGLVVQDFRVGIRFSAGSGNTVEGNIVGLDQTGTRRASNRSGIHVWGSSDNLIGGLNPAARNLVSGNVVHGILVNGGGSGNVIRGNLIGTAIDGLNAPMGNGAWGISIIDSPNNVVGGTAPPARNVVSGNGLVGPTSSISISGALSTGNVVQGNYVGMDVRGFGQYSNGVGVSIGSGASGNMIGGPSEAAGNIIAANGVGRSLSSGVLVSGGTGNAIMSNSIFGNGGLGIDLFGVQGVDLNDAGDVDTGPNGLQNHPVITAAAGNQVEGTLSSAPNTAYRVEVFANGRCDESGYGEGHWFLGSVTATTDGIGEAGFGLSVAGQLKEPFVTATATDPDNNTSEFGPCSSVAADFFLLLENSVAATTAGSSATYKVKLRPLGSELSEPVALSCSGLPDLSQCSFSPAEVITGRSEVTSTLTVTTTAASTTGSLLLWPPPGSSTDLPWIILLGVVATCVGIGVCATTNRPWKSLRWAAPATVVFALMQVSCGGEGGTATSAPVVQPGTPSGNYTITVTGMSQGLSRSTEATLIVQ